MTPRACVLLAVLVSGKPLARLDGRSTRHGLRARLKKSSTRAISKTPGAFIAAGSRSGDDRRLVASDFKQAIQCLLVLGREAKSTLSATVSWSSIKTIGVCCRRPLTVFLTGPQYGFLIAGQFVRGNHRGGGEFVNALEPDRARALKLLQTGVASRRQRARAPGRRRVLHRFREYHLDGPLGRRVVEAAKPHRPVEAPRLQFDERLWPRDGRVLRSMRTETRFHRAPARYDAAKSDGERWAVVRASRRLRLQQPRNRAAPRRQTFSISSSACKR